MRWLTVDPGETAGWALWEDAELVDSGQTPIWNFADLVAENLYVGQRDAPSPSEVGLSQVPDTWDKRIELLVIEDFLLYPWKLKTGEMDWDAVETARLIGALVLAARLANIEVVYQGADIKESAVAGGAEELFVRPLHENRHENDAKMHGVYYIQTKLLNPENAHVEDGKLVPNA